MNKEPICFHCGIPTVIPITCQNSNQTFCCIGCHAVYQLITESGDQIYYQQRSALPGPANLHADYSSFDLPEIQAQLCTVTKEGMQIELLVQGIHCAACTWLIETQLTRIDGVNSVKINGLQNKLSLAWEPKTCSLSSILDALSRLGYSASIWHSDTRIELMRQQYQRLQKHVGVAGLLCMQIGMMSLGIYAGQWQGMDAKILTLLQMASGLLAAVSVFYCASLFLSAAKKSLLNHHISMEVPVSLAIIVAFLASVYTLITGQGETYFDSVSMFIFFLLAGRLFELRTRQNVLQSPVDILPESCIRVTSNQTKHIACSQLEKGDIVLVPSNAMIPRDGILDSKLALIDESAFTGESDPVVKSESDQVLAGTLNLSKQSIRIIVYASRNENSLSRVEQLIDQAMTEKPLSAPLIDRIAGHFLSIVLLSALLTAGYYWWHELPYTISAVVAVLIVACPCALTLATPVAMAVATAKLRKQGLLVTRSSTLQSLSEITDIIFDKTGTLTQPEATIIEQHWLVPEAQRSHFFSIACQLQSHSNHPVAKAFAAFSHPVTPDSLSNVTQDRNGMSAFLENTGFWIGTPHFVQGNSLSPLQSPSQQSGWCVFANSQGPLAWFRIQQGIRPEVPHLIKQLQARQLTIHIVSGDQSLAVEQTALTLGIEHALSEQSPSDKLDYLQTLQGDGKRVLVVGDGVNDVPLSAAADASIAVSEAVGLFKVNADALLLNPHLCLINTVMSTAQRCRSIIRQNIFWALSYNLFTIPLAAMGLIPPWLAAIGMSLSSVFVLLNASRLNHPLKENKAQKDQTTAQSCFHLQSR